MAELAFFDDPGAFLAEAEPHLAADPVLSTVVTSVTHRAVRGELAPATSPRWWAVARDGGAVVGAAMRTAPAEPYPLFVLPMPQDAARALAAALHERGEEVRAVNGALPAARQVAEETGRLTGRRVVVDEHTRLHELGALVPPQPVPGRLRPATTADVPLALEWFAAFESDAAAQAGRTGGHGPLEPQDERSMQRRVDQGRLWFWEDAAGERVHLTGANPPVLGVCRVGPVYTPPVARGHGYASAAVAGVSRLLLDQGHRVCLFTDQANPTSNKIYAALGYRPVTDMANFVLV